MINQVTLLGNLTKDPELRYTPGGQAVADLRVAVNTRFKAKDGTFKESTCFLNVVVWGKQAESAGERLHKGSQVFVEGRLQNRNWETPDGQKRSLIEVVARLLFPLERRAASSAETAPSGEGKSEEPSASEQVQEEEPPF